MALLPFVLSGVATAQTNASARKEIQARYDTMASAIKKKDLKTVMSMFTEDFVNESAGSKQTKKDMEREMRDHLASAQKMEKVSFIASKVTVLGKDAVVEVDMQVKIAVIDTKGDFGKKGKHHVLDVKERDRETWTKTSKGWMLKLSTSLPGGTFLIDGKSVGMAPNGR
jgi:ketosteroid isomerase-like protein